MATRHCSADTTKFCVPLTYTFRGRFAAYFSHGGENFPRLLAKTSLRRKQEHLLHGSVLVPARCRLAARGMHWRTHNECLSHVTLTVSHSSEASTKLWVLRRQAPASCAERRPFSQCAPPLGARELLGTVSSGACLPATRRNPSACAPVSLCSPWAFLRDAGRRAALSCCGW